MEVELKYSLTDMSEKDLAAYLSELRLVPAEFDMHSLYFDVASLYFSSTQSVLRLRRESEHIQLTIKRNLQAEVGLFQRYEWEFQVDDIFDALNLSFHDFYHSEEALAKLQPALVTRLHTKIDRIVCTETKILADLVEHLEREPIRLLCGACFTRLSYKIPWQNALIECVIDRGELIGEKTVSPLLECELELKDGEVVALTELGEQLRQRFSLVPQNLSKFARAKLL